ncbi:hypothetical protein [Thalassobacillus hwangdonensis]|uniref:DUF3221 domain-containing protein n=1 Tax=Thalassobacillus hwangdonensis TaxID=546108 RepID=A0ABW3L678_9BACI
MRKLLVILVFLLGACSEESASEQIETIGSPQVQEILEKNPQADIFVYRAIVYSNAEEVDWVQTVELTLGEEVKVIESEYGGTGVFGQYAATKLPVGTKIYKNGSDRSENSSILIAVVNDTLIPYIGLIEG